MTKRVLLIGNGPSALSRHAGREIDDFDGVVARFNEFHINGFESQVGTRTDEWVTWKLFPGYSDREYSRVLCVAQPPATTWPGIQARYPHARQLSDSVVAETKRRMGYSLPSSGAFAAMAFVLENWEVYLYGFDFFQSQAHHYGDEGQPSPQHSPTFEVAFFRQLLAEGRIRILGQTPETLPSGVIAVAPPVTTADWDRLREKLLDEIRNVSQRLDSAFVEQLRLLREEETLRAESQRSVTAAESRAGALAESLRNEENARMELQKSLDALVADRDAWMGKAKSSQSELASWRTVAKEREAAIEELETVNRWLEANTHKRMEDLECCLRDDRERLLRASQELGECRRGMEAMRATLAWRASDRLRRLCPAETRRGRAIRAVFRLFA